jgi:hypothetical protein
VVEDGQTQPKVEQHQDDKTPFEGFEDICKNLLKVPKEVADKLREPEKRKREKKQAG